MAKKKEADISTQMFLLKLRTAVRIAGGSAEAGRQWGVAPQHIGSALSAPDRSSGNGSVWAQRLDP